MVYRRPHLVYDGAEVEVQLLGQRANAVRRSAAATANLSVAVISVNIIFCAVVITEIAPLLKEPRE